MLIYFVYSAVFSLTFESDLICKSVTCLSKNAQVGISLPQGFTDRYRITATPMIHKTTPTTGRERELPKSGGLCLQVQLQQQLLVAVVVVLLGLTQISEEDIEILPMLLHLDQGHPILVPVVREDPPQLVALPIVRDHPLLVMRHRQPEVAVIQQAKPGIILRPQWEHRYLQTRQQAAVAVAIAIEADQVVFHILGLLQLQELQLQIHRDTKQQ